MAPQASPPNATPEQATRSTLVRFVVLLALALAFSSLAPPDLFAATLSSLLFYAGFFTGLFALIGQEPLPADRLSRWDMAAAFIAASLLAGFFVSQPPGLE
ncbi:MAG: hypothetical protein ACFB3T_10810 [Geminicoccaceae bacterium]